MPSTMTRLLTFSAFAALLFAGAMATPALAQAAGKNESSAQPSAATPAELGAEARKIALQLNAIEKAALKANKDLHVQGQNLSKHIAKLMKSKGFFPDADRLELISLKKSIESGKLSKDERKAKIHEFRGVQARILKGRQVAMQDKDLQKESREYGQATMLAMQKQDPQTRVLLQRLASIRQQLTEMHRQQQAKH